MCHRAIAAGCFLTLVPWVPTARPVYEILCTARPMPAGTISGVKTTVAAKVPLDDISISPGITICKSCAQNKSSDIAIVYMLSHFHFCFTPVVKTRLIFACPSSQHFLRVCLTCSDLYNESIRTNPTRVPNGYG